MASVLTITFNEDFELGYGLKYSTSTRNTVQWDWVVNRVLPNQVTVGTPTATVGETTALNFKAAHDADLGTVDYTLVASSNVLTITSNTDGEVFNGLITLDEIGRPADVTFTITNEYEPVAPILTRSPYFVSSNENDLEKIQVKLFIYEGTNVDDRDYDNPNFVLTSQAVNGEAYIDIAPFVDDYLEQEFDGTYSTDSVWLDYEIATYSIGNPEINSFSLVRNLAFEGYGYFEEGQNPNNGSGLMQSNRVVVKLDDEPNYIPLDTNKVSNITYELGGQSIFTKNISPNIESTTQIDYVSSAGDNAQVYESRVLLDSGIYEGSPCLDALEDEITTFDWDKAYIQTESGIELITVKHIEECKYSPIKLTFTNKFGALQDLWMFKTSKLSMNTKKEQYRSNIRGFNGYSTNNHQYRNFQVSGKESLSVNSGFYPEEYNEVFAEALLSRKVWVNYNGKTLPVNIKTSDISYKTRLNDKLISYSMDLEFAYDKINSVR